MTPTTLVVGLGDPARADDALGPLALAALSRAGRTNAGVAWLDTPALTARDLPVLGAVRRVLVLTTVHAGGRPGAVHRLTWQGEGPGLAPRLPLLRAHGVELLRTLHYWVDPPPELVLLGVETGSPAEDGPPHPAVGRALPALVAAAMHQLREWGHELALHPRPSIRSTLP